MTEPKKGTERLIELAEKSGVKLTARVPADAVEATRKRVAHAPNISVEPSEPGGVAVFLAKKRPSAASD